MRVASVLNPVTTFLNGEEDVPDGMRHFDISGVRTQAVVNTVAWLQVSLLLVCLDKGSHIHTTTLSSIQGISTSAHTRHADHSEARYAAVSSLCQAIYLIKLCCRLSCRAS